MDLRVSVGVQEGTVHRHLQRVSTTGRGRFLMDSQQYRDAVSDYNYLLKLSTLSLRTQKRQTLILSLKKSNSVAQPMKDRTPAAVTAVPLSFTHLAAL